MSYFLWTDGTPEAVRLHLLCKMVPIEEEGWFWKGSCHHLSVPNSTGTISGSAWMYLEQVLKFWTKYPMLSWYLILMEVLHLEVAHIYTVDNSDSIIIGLTIVLIPVRLVHHYSVLLKILVSLRCRMQRILASSVSNTSAQWRKSWHHLRHWQ